MRLFIYIMRDTKSLHIIVVLYYCCEVCQIDTPCWGLVNHGWFNISWFPTWVSLISKLLIFTLWWERGTHREVNQPTQSGAILISPKWNIYGGKPLAIINQMFQIEQEAKPNIVKQTWVKTPNYQVLCVILLQLQWLPVICVMTCITKASFDFVLSIQK